MKASCKKSVSWAELAINFSHQYILWRILKFCRYAYSVLTLNLTLPIGRSSEGLMVSAEARFAGEVDYFYGICCHKSDRELLWEIGAESVAAFLHSFHPHVWVPYPVPHCSSLVTFSCRRLFSHASSSCLRATLHQRPFYKTGKHCTRRSHLDSPILGGGPRGVRFGRRQRMKESLEGVDGVHWKRKSRCRGW